MNRSSRISTRRANGNTVQAQACVFDQTDASQHPPFARSLLISYVETGLQALPYSSLFFGRYTWYVPHIVGSRCRKYFSRTRSSSICHTSKWLAVSRLRADFNILITGTPLANRTVNLSGLLHLLYRGPNSAIGHELSHYQKVKDNISAHNFSETRQLLTEHCHLLNPRDFRHLTGASRNEQISAYDASILLPPSLGLTQIRRVMASENSYICHIRHLKNMSKNTLKADSQTLDFCQLRPRLHEQWRMNVVEQKEKAPNFRTECQA